jgi:hypothetical protein
VAAEHLHTISLAYPLVTEAQAVEVRVVGCPAALLEAQPVLELLVKDLQVQAAELIGTQAVVAVLEPQPHKQELKLLMVAPAY